MFIQALAARVGNLLNIQDIARDCSISHATAKNWLSVLTTSRIIYLLMPYFKNITKRVVKTPKIYFTDTGLLTHLLRYKDAETLFAGAVSGNVFENMIIMEALKYINNTKSGDNLYFYRDNNYVEIDLIVDKEQSFNMYEIKASKTLKSEMAKNLIVVNLYSSKKFLISFNETKIPLNKETIGIPWWDFEGTFA
jgi:predicted AAA+ superfamily ATPase